MFLGLPISASRAHAPGQTGRVDLGSLWGLGGPPLSLCLFVLHPSRNQFTCTIDNDSVPTYSHGSRLRSMTCQKHSTSSKLMIYYAAAR